MCAIGFVPVAPGQSEQRVVAAISVSVTADGAPVTDLNADDFVVRENGVPVRVERLEGPGVGINVAVVVDPSPSNDHGLDWVHQTVSDLVEAVVQDAEDAGEGGTGNRVALVVAQSPPEPFLELTADKATLDAGVDGIESTGRPTNRIFDRTVDAFLMLLDTGTPRGAVVVLTDGIDVGSDRGEEAFLRAVRVAGLPLYVLATDNSEGYSGGLRVRAESIPGNERFRAALSGIADQSEQFYLALRDRWRERAAASGGVFVEVEAAGPGAAAGIGARLNATYTLYFYSSGPGTETRDSAIEVEVARSGVEVRSPTGIWWPEP